MGSAGTRVVIIHGAWGMPLENWFPWMSDDLAARGFEVVVPWFPTPEGQHLDTWRAMFQSEVRALSGGTVLVGHSLGAVFMLRILERAAAPVRASFFVAGFLHALGIEELDAANSSFVLGAFNWEKIRANAGRTAVYHSDNDPYVPLEMGRELAEKLGAEFKLVPGAGHFNLEAGYDRFDLLRDDILAAAA